MVHSNHLVASIKVGGRHLREYKTDGNNTVYLPYGCEYSLYFKNLHGEPAVVDVEIDGETAIKGLVVPGKKPGTSGWESNVVELERFHNKGDMSSGYRFKFIEKTDKIREHKGEGPEDGLITITYRFAKPKPVVKPRPQIDPWPDTWRKDEWTNNMYSSHVRRVKPRGTETTSSRRITNKMSNQLSYGGTMSMSDAPMAAGAAFSAQVGNDEGITVEGSQSAQSFTYTSVGPLETQTHTIVFSLRGDIGQEKGQVTQAVTTRQRIECKTCGTRQTTNNKYCKECGTSILAQV